MSLSERLLSLILSLGGQRLVPSPNTDLVVSLHYQDDMTSRVIQNLISRDLRVNTHIFNIVRNYAKLKNYSIHPRLRERGFLEDY